MLVRRSRLLEKAKERSLEQHLRLRAPQTWTVNDGGLGQSAHANGNWCRDCQRVLAVAKLDTRKRGVDTAVPSAAIVARPNTSERCADNVRNLLASQVPRAAVARVLA